MNVVIDPMQDDAVDDEWFSCSVPHVCLQLVEQNYWFSIGFLSLNTKLGFPDVV